MLKQRSILGVVALVGLTVSASALALPPISRPFGTEPPLPVQGTGSTNGVGVASDGENSLILFDDGRDLRGMLADAAGKPLFGEMATYGLSSEPGTGKYGAKVAYGGGKYLAVWTDSNNGLEARLIGADGVAEGDVFPIRLDAVEPQLVWVGDHFLLLTVELDGQGRDVAVTTITLDGQVGEPKKITSVGTASQTAIALGEAGLLVTWIPNTDGTNLSLEGMIIDGDGATVVPPFNITSGSFPSDTSVRSSATGYLVSWGQYEGVRAATVSPGGEVSPILEVVNDDNVSAVTSGVNAVGYTILWQDYGEDGYPTTTLRHVSFDGQLGQETHVLETSVYRPALVGKGEGYWYAVADTGLFGVLTDNDLTPTSERSALSLVQNSQYTSELLWDGAGYVMVFDDDRGGKYTSNGRVMRFDTAGVPDAPRSLALDEPSETGSWYSATSLGDANVLIGRGAFEAREVSFRTLTSDGTLTPLIEQGGFGSSGGVTLASFEGTHVAVYASPVAGEFVAQEFSAAGEPVGEPRALPVPTTTYEVRILTSAEGFVLQINNNPGTSLAALNEDWTLGEPQPVGDGSFPIDFVVGGDKTLAVWSIAGTARTARFWSNGAWDGQAMTLTEDGSWGDTTWDGARFIAVWSDTAYHAHLTTIDNTGVVAPPELLFEDEECNGPVLTSNGAGQSMLSCVRYNRDYSRRIVSYLIGEGADAVVDVPTDDRTDDPDVTTSPAVSSGGDGPAAPGATTDSLAPADVTAAPAESSTPVEAPVDVTAEAAPTSSDAATATAAPDVPAPQKSGCDVSAVGRGGVERWFGVWLVLSVVVAARRRVA